MVSESDIAEARRKALRNGEEDPVTVAQRYLNVYRQMHIFTPERKAAFDQSLLNLSPISISIIASLPGGLTFQDYIDEVLSSAGRQKSARDNTEINIAEAPVQPQVAPQVQTNVQPQQVIAPVVSGPATLSMDKNFADEFAKVMGGVIDKQTSIQQAGLAKIAQDLGKTQLFIAKKLEDAKVENNAQISELCKTIAQSHTALSSSLATAGQNAGNQLSAENTVISVPSVERKPEDDIRLAEMIAQSQERMMSEFFARMPQAQAVGVGNVNVTTPSRSVDDDARLVEMINQSQERLMSKLIENLPQNTAGNNSIKDTENLEKMVALMSQSQEKLISVLVEKLPQISNTGNQNISSNVSPSEDGERLALAISQSQEKIMALLVEKMSQLNTQKTHSQEDDDRLARLIVRSQEGMIRSLVDKKILNPGNDNSSSNNTMQVATLLQKIATMQADNEYNMERAINSVMEAQAQMYDKMSRKQAKELSHIISGSMKNFSQSIYTVLSSMTTDQPMPQPTFTADAYNNSAYAPQQDYYSENNINSYNGDDVNFEMFTEVDSADDNISDILYDENYNQNNYVETDVELKKKKKKKKKKRNNNISDGDIALQEIATEGFVEDDTDILSDIENTSEEIAFVEPIENINNVVAQEDVETPTVDNIIYEQAPAEDVPVMNFDEMISTPTVEAVPVEEVADNTLTYAENIVEETSKDVAENIVEETDEAVDIKAEEQDITDAPVVSDIESNENKWLSFDEEEKPVAFVEPVKVEFDSETAKADWGFGDEDDSWGIESNDEKSSNEDDGEWEYVEDDGSQDDGEWEYVEDDGSQDDGEWEYVEDDGSQDDGEWEYVEDDGSQDDGEWEYVEAIDDNAKIYSSDSYNQGPGFVENMSAPQKMGIPITNIPQIYDETSEEEIDDPYKNSILKD